MSEYWSSLLAHGSGQISARGGTHRGEKEECGKNYSGRVVLLDFGVENLSINRCQFIYFHGKKKLYLLIYLRCNHWFVITAWHITLSGLKQFISFLQKDFFFLVPYHTLPYQVLDVYCSSFIIEQIFILNSAFLKMIWKTLEALNELNTGAKYCTSSLSHFVYSWQELRQNADYQNCTEKRDAFQC